MSQSVLVFDSGVGGLTVASEIRQRLPGVCLSYVSDTGYFPYGKKPLPRLRQRIITIVKKAVNQARPDIVVVACNTASTIVLDELRQEIALPVVGVVPAIKPAAALTASGVVAIIGTRITAGSDYLDTLIHTYAGNCRVIVENSEALVLEAEKKIAGAQVDREIIRQEISRLMQYRGAESADILVLACTHFPLLAQEISSCLPPDIKMIDSGAAIANRVGQLLGRPPAPGQSPLHCDFYVSTPEHNYNTTQVETLLAAQVRFKVLA